MDITARVVNRQSNHTVYLKSGASEHSLTISPRPDGSGSITNGGELLLLALATCYCNDIYREARKRDLKIEAVQVEASAEFGGEGEPAQNIRYRAAIITTSPKEKVYELMTDTDLVAEVHNTLRRPTEVALTQCEVHEA